MERSEYIKRWLWHAFQGLDNEGTVDPQELKVLTAHVGASLGADNKGNMAHKVTQQKYKCDSTLALCFSNYLEFLEEQGFLHNDKVDLNKLEGTLWSLCLKDYQKRDHKMVADAELKKLWQTFNFLAEPDSLPYCIDREEMVILMEKLVVAMGMKWDIGHFDHVTKNLKLFTFMKMLVCFESAFAKGMDQLCIAEAVMEVYDEIIEEVEKKGFLVKKGHMMKNWKERWFVLKPGCLSYYTGRNEKDKKGDIFITSTWETGIIPDQKHYKNVFAIWTEDKNDKDKTRYELSASDPRTRQAWIIALNAIIQRERNKGLGQYGELLKRRQRRKKEQEQEEQERQLKEEERRRKEAELREERRAQEEAARKAAEELALTKAKEEEERKLRQQEKEARTRAEEDAEKMKQARLEAERRLEEEANLRRAKEEEERLRRQLDEEERERIASERDEIKRALEDASKRADMEAGLKEAEQRRLAELEETLRHLQMLLDEEKRARMEEERVKELQQRLLEEEMERRELLEQMKEEQSRMLAREQQRRESLEVLSEELVKQREEQAAALEEERGRLIELEQKRQAADEQLKVAMAKIAVTEKNREVIQRKRDELSKMKTSLGLAKSVQPKLRPLVTHRGLPASAFTAEEIEISRPHQPHEPQEQKRANNLQAGGESGDGQSMMNGQLNGCEGQQTDP